MVILVLTIVLPILCGFLGYFLGYQRRRHLNNVEKASPPLLPQTNPIKEEPNPTILQEVCIHHASSEDEKIQNSSAPATSSSSSVACRLPNGLPTIKTPMRPHFSNSTQSDPTPFSTETSCSVQQQQQQQILKSPFASPTAHLMGHFVRCASQAMDDFESRSVLHRLTSADASTPFFGGPQPSSSPSTHFFSTPVVVPAGLLTPTAVGAAPAGSDEIHMDEVDLMNKLGAGAFASVYRAEWNGASVAIKYIRITNKAASLGAAVREVLLSKKLSHPNVVQTFSWTVLSQPEEEIEDEDEDALQSGFSKSTRGIFGVNSEEDAGTSSASAIDNRKSDYSIPAVWPTHPHPHHHHHHHHHQNNPSFSSLHTKNGGKETQYTPAVDSSAMAAALPQSSEGRGVKRRRTDEAIIAMSTPSPAGSKSLSPADVKTPLSMVSFNSEEGFGSPAKKKHGGVQSIFSLEGLKLDANEALLVVVMEHCDVGSLQRALQRKAFLPSAKWPHHVTFRALLRTAAEIAKGMEYIHAQHGIIHGDLKPANVLLKTHKADRRGYIAKVADFGMSRHVEEVSSAASHPPTSSGLQCEKDSIVGGTLNYLAPEAFEAPTMRGRPSDVYAYGILLYEMYHCRAPYEGMLDAQICVGVVEGWLRPEFAQECPIALRTLAERCWAQDPEERPTFAEIGKELVQIEVQFRSQRHRSMNAVGKDGSF